MLGSRSFLNRKSSMSPDNDMLLIMQVLNYRKMRHYNSAGLPWTSSSASSIRCGIFPARSSTGVRRFSLRFYSLKQKRDRFVLCLSAQEQERQGDSQDASKRGKLKDHPVRKEKIAKRLLCYKRVFFLSTLIINHVLLNTKIPLVSLF